MSYNNTTSISGIQYAKAVAIDDTPEVYRTRGKKKMGWFKRKFAQWSRDAWEDARRNELEVPGARNSPEAKSHIRFTVYPANGGYVIEHYKYDRMRDGDGPTLTIVNNGDSMGTAVEHILAIEALKA